MRSPREQEQGSIVLLLLALLASMALATALTARSGLQRHRLARRAYHRAVARNLAEAGIVAGRLGRAVPADLSRRLSEVKLAGKVRLVRRPLPGGRQQLESTVVLSRQGSDAPILRYVIEAIVRRRPGGDETLSWRERQLP